MFGSAERSDLVSGSGNNAEAISDSEAAGRECEYRDSSQSRSKADRDTGEGTSKNTCAGACEITDETGDDRRSTGLVSDLGFGIWDFKFGI